MFLAIAILLPQPHVVLLVQHRDGGRLCPVAARTAHLSWHEGGGVAGASPFPPVRARACVCVCVCACCVAFIKCVYVRTYVRMYARTRHGAFLGVRLSNMVLVHHTHTMCTNLVFALTLSARCAHRYTCVYLCTCDVFITWHMDVCNTACMYACALCSYSYIFTFIYMCVYLCTCSVFVTCCT